MKPVIGFAERVDEEEVGQLLREHGMDLSGDIREHVVCRSEGKIRAAGKLALVRGRDFHLEVIGVRDDECRKGWGGILLTELTSAPWRFCRSDFMPHSGSYLVTTVARGSSTGFYYRQGFRDCGFGRLPEEYREQCGGCPDFESCRPVPMYLIKTEVISDGDLL